MLACEKISEAVERDRHVRMVLAERALEDRERVAVHRLGLGELALVLEQVREEV